MVVGADLIRRPQRPNLLKQAAIWPGKHAVSLICSPVTSMFFNRM
jgi:hypothetical protein